MQSDAAFSYVLQLESKKNGIEIELNESLRRRHDELRLKLDSLADDETGESSSVDDLTARTRELQTLNNAIQALTKKTQGRCNILYSQISAHPFCRHGEGERPVDH